MHSDSFTTNKLILGTVQFGLRYGINNSSPKPTNIEVFEILHIAREAGISILDTADAYGNATELIGRLHHISEKSFNIITKFKEVNDEINFTSWMLYTLEKLKVQKLYACMYHSINDYLYKPHLIKELIAFYNEGVIEKIGISIYTNEQFEKVINDPSVHLVQLPFNLLDNDNIRGSLIKKAKEEGKTIHVRSVFLQGLFFINLANLPTKLKPLGKYLNLLNTLCKDLDITIQALALGYVCQNQLIDGVIIGVDNAAQLQSNLAVLSSNLPQSAIEEVNKIIVSAPELLNPVNWS